jgi:carbon monoxide dehydrogenase subunit G
LQQGNDHGVYVIELKEKFSVPAPPDEVWPLISDPAVVAACIPGAELNELTPEGAHRGKVTFKFGPTVAVFRGEAKLTYDHPVKRCLIEARGIDQRGASRARARFDVEAKSSSEGGSEGADTTDVTLEGGFEVAGPLEMFASAGGVHVARALLAEFAANIARVIEQRRAGGGDAVPEQAPAASGAKILGRALVDGARSIIGKNDKGNT